MKRFFLYLLAVIGGIVGGAVLGTMAGIILTTVFQTSQFEGKAGYVVFLYFMPLGALAGLFAGPWLMARRLARGKAPAAKPAADS